MIPRERAWRKHLSNSYQSGDSDCDCTGFDPFGAFLCCSSGGDCNCGGDDCCVGVVAVAFALALCVFAGIIADCYFFILLLSE